MKDKISYQENQDKVLLALHRNTISMSLVIIVLGVIILPLSDASSTAFVPLVLSMIVSTCTFIWACFSLRRQVKKMSAQKQKPS